MEEVKQYHRNLAVACYDFKMAYDKGHHDCMLRVYEWICIPKEVAELIYQLMNKWKTRLERWSKRDKVTSRWIEILCGFCTEIVTHPLDFAYLRYQYASYYNKTKAIECESL